jgi:signal peptidase II
MHSRKRNYAPRKPKDQKKTIKRLLSFVFEKYKFHLFAVVIFIIATKKTKSKLIDFFLLLMVSGGIGNIIDRIRLGYVVDFIEPLFVDFAVFNFADCLITVGAFVLIGYLILDIVKDTKKSNKANSDDLTVNNNGAD